MLRKIRWELPLVAVIAAILGIVAGHQFSHAGEHSKPEPAAGDAKLGHEEPSFSPAAIASLGIESAPAQRGSFSVERGIAAMIADRTTTTRIVTAPLGGVITAITVNDGDRVATGTTLLRVLRDPIPRPTLDISRPHVFPDHDEIHATFGELRTAMVTMANARSELERIENLSQGEGDLPLVPRQRVIDLRYEIARATAGSEHARHELLRHGFTSEQIAAVLEHEDVVLFDADHAQRCLSHAGLWSAAATQTLAALPDLLRTQPITVGCVAELDARGIALPPLNEWLAGDPQAAARFLDVTALLLGGATLEQVRGIAAQNGLSESIDVPTPSNDEPLQVAEIFVNVGEHVEPGTPIARLRDDSKLLLLIRPLGSESETIRAAMTTKTTCRATSLVPGEGPALTDLVIAGLRNDAQGTVVWCDVDNPLLPGDRTSTHAARALQPGMRYSFRIPTTSIEDAFLVPRDALATLGGARIVFLAEANGHFHPQPVRILAEDGDRLAVTGADPATNELTDDSEIVVRGAYALAMAMGNAPLEHSHDH